MDSGCPSGSGKLAGMKTTESLEGRIYWVQVGDTIWVFRNHFSTVEEVYNCVATMQRMTGLRVVLRDEPPAGFTVEDPDEVVPIVAQPCDRQRFFSLVWEPPAEPH
jgi:hypothetical protein